MLVVRTRPFVAALFSIAILIGCGAADGTDDSTSMEPTGEPAGAGGSELPGPSGGGAGEGGANQGGANQPGTGGTKSAGGAGGVASSAGAGGRSGGSAQGGMNTGGMSNPSDAGGHAGQLNTDGGTTSSRQTKKPLGAGSGAPNGFYEYLPPGYGAAPVPLLVFWSGVGQEGNGTTDLPNILAYGPPAMIAKDIWGNNRPFIVLSAQYTPKSGQIAPGAACPSGEVINAFITWALSAYNVDKKRVYLTGLSCGGIGTWDYLGKYKGSVIAAAVPIAGNPGEVAQSDSAWGRSGCGLGEAAIWSFHGDKDDVVPFGPDQATMNNLIACPAPPRRKAVFTNVAGAGHGIWDP